MFLAASILPASCISIPDDLDNKEIEESISLIQARTIEGIQDALDQPIVVVSQTGDTVVAYSPDSIAEGSPVRKITVHVDEHKRHASVYHRPSEAINHSNISHYYSMRHSASDSTCHTYLHLCA